jgi:methylmalonyl-CoA/ethylmalonyl-CoA epimerase
VRVKQVNHLGLLVSSVEGAADGFRALGLDVDRTERIGDEVDVAFMPCGELDVELLVPLGDGPLDEELTRSGPAIQHVAFEVDDLDGALEELARQGIGTVGEAPRAGAGNMRIAFLDPRRFGGILVELCQPNL